MLGRSMLNLSFHNNNFSSQRGDTLSNNQNESADSNESFVADYPQHLRVFLEQIISEDTTLSRSQAAVPESMPAFPSNNIDQNTFDTIVPAYPPRPKLDPKVSASKATGTPYALTDDFKQNAFDHQPRHTQETDDQKEMLKRNIEVVTDQLEALLLDDADDTTKKTQPFDWDTQLILNEDLLIINDSIAFVENKLIVSSQPSDSVNIYVDYNAITEKYPEIKATVEALKNLSVGPYTTHQDFETMIVDNDLVDLFKNGTEKLRKLLRNSNSIITRSLVSENYEAAIRKKAETQWLQAFTHIVDDVLQRIHFAYG